MEGRLPWLRKPKGLKKPPRRKPKKQRSRLGRLKAYYTPAYLHKRLQKLAKQLDVGISDLHAEALERGLQELESLEFEELSLSPREEPTGPGYAIHKLAKIKTLVPD